MLNMNFILSSVSGIGIYRNWNTDGPSMPQVYEKTDFQVRATGTGILKRMHPVSSVLPWAQMILVTEMEVLHRLPFDSVVFVNNYIRFIELVKSKYPNARIALLSSPMLNGNKRILLQNCLTIVKAGIKNTRQKNRLRCFFFQPMQARGCGGHPNVEDHEILAEELAPFFKKLI